MNRTAGFALTLLTCFAVIGVLDFAVPTRSAAGREAGADDFYMYQLEVFCDPKVATVIFNATGKGLMGTKVICAGQCEGRTVSLKDALAPYPAHIGQALTGKVEQYERDAAAGKGPSIAGCLAPKAPESKCDKKKACEALKSINDLIAKYQGPPGYYFGSFAEFKQKLAPLLQKLSESLACRFNPGHDPKDAAVLNDYIGQMLKDMNGFKTLTDKSQVPQKNTACKAAALGRSPGPACDDYYAIERIGTNAAALAAAIGCEAPPKDVPPAKKDCKELSNGVLDGLTTFFDELDKLKPKKQLGEGDSYDQVADGIEGALDQLEEAAEEIEGTGGTGSQQYKEIQEKIGKLKKLLDVWRQMKAASCLPPEVEQLLRRLATEKKAGTEHKATCTELCAATADWYVKITGQPNLRSSFFKACTLACF